MFSLGVSTYSRTFEHENPLELQRGISYKTNLLSQHARNTLSYESDSDIYEAYAVVDRSNYRLDQSFACNPESSSLMQTQMLCMVDSTELNSPYFKYNKNGWSKQDYGELAAQIECSQHNLLSGARTTQSIINDPSPSKPTNRKILVPGDRLSTKKKPVASQWLRKDTRTTATKSQHQSGNLERLYGDTQEDPTVALMFAFMNSVRPTKMAPVNFRR